MMKLRVLLCSLFLVISFISCKNKNSQAANTKTNGSALPSAPSGNNRAGWFDDLENIFKNENWLLVNGKDSSYFYCSRLGKTYFKTYLYKVFKGDSVNTVITEIKLAGDTIVWQIPNSPGIIWLVSATSEKALWTDKTNMYFRVNKIDDNNIRILCPGGVSRNLLKTQTISSFLIRCKYDYRHGTKLAFSKRN